MGLRFAPELELPYALQHLRRMQRRVRFWFTGLAILAVGFAMAALLARTSHFHELKIRGVSDWIHIAVDCTCLPLLLWLVWRRNYGPTFRSIAPYLLPIYLGSAAIVIAQVIASGDREAIAWMTLIVTATYFFSGLMFRAAVVSNIVTILAFGAAVFTEPLPLDIILRELMILLTTSAICAIVCRDSEYISRRSFLEAGLLGEYSSRDSLTGLLNRRAFGESLQLAWERATLTGQSLAVLMIDIDHFKSYNDSHGHQAGDAVIRDVGRIIGTLVRRPLDLAARYGGEEFSVVLLHLTRREIEDIAERARQGIASLDRPTTSGGILPVTVSIGIAMTTPNNGRTPEGAIQLADEALYEAKAAGRNRIVLKDHEEYHLLRTGAFKKVGA